MEYTFLQIFALLRPVLFMDLGGSLFGLDLLEIMGILLSAILIVGLLGRAALTKTLRISPIDLSIAAFVLWCIAVWLIYLDKAHLKELAKLIIPLITYIVVKNSINDEAQYRRIIWMVLLGFSVPIAISAALTVMGEGVYLVNYWSGAPRYKGAFSGPHDMAHYMTLTMMLVILYALLHRAGQAMESIGHGKVIFLICLSIAALYCLYQTWVRTAIAGFVIFCVVLLVTFRKRAVAGLFAMAVIAPLLFVESVQNRLMYERINAEKDVTFQVTDYAGGRPRMWRQFMSEFSNYPMDKQIAGIGIGNGTELWRTDIWGSADDSDANRLGVTHNDFLEVLVQTGYVGLALFLLLQVIVFRSILRLPKPRRGVFIAAFIAVAAMNMGSASYITRFGLAQMYYLMLAYIELPRRRNEREEQAMLSPNATISTLRRLPL